MFATHLIFAVGLLGQQGPLEREVTFTAQADAIDKVLPVLSKAAGIPLTVSGMIGKEILVLRFDKVPLKDALAKIGQAAVAHWQPVGDGYQLVRGKADLDPIFFELRKRNVAWLSRLLPLATRELAATGPLTQQKALVAIEEKRNREEIQDWLEEEADQDRNLNRLRVEVATSPEARYLLRILQGMGLERLAAVCALQKDAVVVATNPTSLQVPLPYDPSLGATYLAEHNASARAYMQSDLPGADEPFVIRRWSRRFMARGAVLSEPPAKVLLTIRAREPELYVEGSFYDSGGRLMSSGNLSLNGILPSDPEPAKEPLPKEAPLEISDQAFEMALLVEFGQTDIEHRQPSAELLSKMLHPNEVEPLSLCASEVLLAAARQRHENLAACLPDFAYATVGWNLRKGSTTPRDVLENLDDDSTSCVEKDGWVVVRPAKPQSSLDSRFHRGALAKLLQQGAKTGILSIEDFAEFAFACPGDEDGYGSVVVDDTLRKEFTVGSNDWLLLKLYGSLSPLQRQDLKAGKKLSFLRLTPKQADWIISLILGDYNPYFQVEGEDEAGYFMGGAAGFTGSPWQMTSTRLALHPTELLARGLDPVGWLELTPSQEPEIWVESQGWEEGTDGEVSSLEEIARRLYYAKHPELQSGDERPILRLRPQTSVRLRFKFHLKTGLSWETELMDTLRDQGPAFAVANMPGPMRKQVDEFFKQFDEEVKNGQMGPPDLPDIPIGPPRKPPPR